MHDGGVPALFKLQYRHLHMLLELVFYSHYDYKHFVPCIWSDSAEL